MFKAFKHGICPAHDAAPTGTNRPCELGAGSNSVQRIPRPTVDPSKWTAQKQGHYTGASDTMSTTSRGTDTRAIHDGLTAGKAIATGLFVQNFARWIVEGGIESEWDAYVADDRHNNP